jgi:S-DNA-T family DNA segregation ATPase FtsK/SpoIIIE
MERRYACLHSLEVRDIRSYNKRIRERGIAVEHLPYIVVIIDEFADLMTLAGKELESALARLAAMSRAVGIHLILSTQHPSIDIITGKLKANIPGRVAFMVANKIDSRLILDAPGAEKLLGKGDMLYAGSEDAPARIQGAYISQEEAERAAEYVKTLGYPDYIDDELFIDDENAAEGDQLYERAVDIVIQAGKASAGYLQRRLKIGYNRAARLIDRMEEQGLIIPVIQKE